MLWQFADAKNLLDQGQLGRLYALRLISHDHQPPPEQFVSTSGGLFRDLGVHDYDLARWLTSEEVAAMLSEERLAEINRRRANAQPEDMVPHEDVLAMLDERLAEINRRRQRLLEDAVPLERMVEMLDERRATEAVTESADRNTWTTAN